jgi:hypothetical protein
MKRDNLEECQRLVKELDKIDDVLDRLNGKFLYVTIAHHNSEIIKIPIYETSDHAYKDVGVNFKAGNNLLSQKIKKRHFI